MIDYGSRAPASVFQAIFEQEGVPITPYQSREPMGLAKREHIQAILNMPDVQDRWRQAKGQPGQESDVDRMYEQFLPMQKQALSSHSELIPGVLQTIKWCEERGIRIAGTTGYTRELMEVVLPLAAQQGYCPELSLTAEDVPAGRPAPWMIFRIAEAFSVYPLSQCMKVDDTVVGIHAGRNAGCWTVAVTKSGNELGLSEEEIDALPAGDLAARLAAAEQKFLDNGAHFVIESVADLPRIIEEIEAGASGP